MSTKDSTTSSRPAKPYPDFPLYAHKSGRWAKKIREEADFYDPRRTCASIGVLVAVYSRQIFLGELCRRD